MTLSPREIADMAERAEQIALSMARHAFADSIMWDAKALASAADAFTVAASLRSILKEGGNGG